MFKEEIGVAVVTYGIVYGKVDNSDGNADVILHEECAAVSVAYDSNAASPEASCLTSARIETAQKPHHVVDILVRFFHFGVRRSHRIAIVCVRRVDLHRPVTNMAPGRGMTPSMERRRCVRG